MAVSLPSVHLPRGETGARSLSVAGLSLLAMGQLRNLGISMLLLALMTQQEVLDLATYPLQVSILRGTLFLMSGKTEFMDQFFLPP